MWDVAGQKRKKKELGEMDTGKKEEQGKEEREKKKKGEIWVKKRELLGWAYEFFFKNTTSGRDGTFGI